MYLRLSASADRPREEAASNSSVSHTQSKHGNDPRCLGILEKPQFNWHVSLASFFDSSANILLCI